jgi:chromatin assembly factor 1 subunit B
VSVFKVKDYLVVKISLVALAPRMKIIPQEVYLHGSGKLPEYVYSVDISEKFPDGIERIATGGADPVARVWSVDAEGALMIRSELIAHSRGVNCVRFSPRTGEILATASDDGQVLLWKLGSSSGQVFGSDVSIESWTAVKKLNCLDEITHLSWSPEGSQIACSLQREMSIIFDVLSGRPIQRLDGHNGRVHGIAWDPLNEFIASHSSDRSVRIYSRTKKKKSAWFTKAQFRELPPSREEIDAGKKASKLFMSETHFTADPTSHFFRRLEFSPDGSTLAAPGGLTGDSFSCVFFARTNFFSGAAPVATLPTADCPCVAVRFHPRRFQAADGNEFFVFAVVCVQCVMICSSRQQRPLLVLADLHCTAVLDAAWSADASILALVSSDGYATLIRFDKGELGGLPMEAVHTDVVMEQPATTPEVRSAPMPVSEPSGDGSKRRKITPVLVG